ncbi:MAG: cytochrome d ubiquinol oxidase subunit II [Acidimicrobiia bacterium]|nr:cytochrome d ubiquinol oxidase subunit II [Acidimicrobiia bacterium]
MTAAEGVAAVMFGAVILYAVLGGADFGSGVWDLTAGRSARGASLRKLVDHAIGPVWEANHVWLIFVLVLLWTGFPEPYTDLVRAVAIPLWLAALGIVGRGASFAFRSYAPTLGWARSAGIIFGSASLITPFFLGTIAGAVASGRVPAEGPVSPWSSWLGPTSLLGGVLAIVTCTFLAGVFLAAEAERLDAHRLAEQIRDRSLIGGALTGAVVVAGVPVLLVDAPKLADGLLGRGLVLVVLSAVGGLVTMRLLWRRRFRLARLSAVIAVAAVVAGWGVAQYPWILVDETTIADGAGSHSALVGLLVASAIAAILVAPPLLYLFRLADADLVGKAPDLGG